MLEDREATWQQNLRGRRLSVREGELMRQRALDSTLSKKTVFVDPFPTHELRTSYKGGQGLCIWIAVVRGRESGGDNTIRPTSRKVI